MIGRVYLVGAGPGDPELLTVKALGILQRANLVLHDDLVSPSILGFAPAGAQIVNIGKRCGKKSASQTEINARMIAGARQGLTVVRLKGGDPSMFGRLGEEIESLRDADVDFEIVPAVTAASAAAAAAGVSLTHRDLASSVVFLTGHRAARQTPFEATRTTRPVLDSAGGDLAGKTLVIYMPGPAYGSVCAELQASGVRSEAPCLLVSAASMGIQRIHKTTVQELANAPALAAPTILIVGEVTRFAHKQVRPEREFRLFTLYRSVIMRRDRDHEASDLFDAAHRP